MIDPSTRERAAELGLPADTPFGFWVNGRAGALGDVSAAVAAAAIGFMSPGLVERHWTARPDELSALDAAAEYAASAANWGRNVLSGMSDAELDELTGLCIRVADAANPSVGVLFAGWRDVALPDDSAGAATVAMNVVRELRGGAYLSAVHAVGLGPLGAIISTDDPVRGGPSWAETFGWAGPWPDVDADARRDAEDRTSAIVARVIDAALDDEQQGRLVTLVAAARSGMES